MKSRTFATIAIIITTSAPTAFGQMRGTRHILCGQTFLGSILTVFIYFAVFSLNGPIVKASGSHLDYSFSSNGRLLTDFGSIFNQTEDVANAVVLQSNGKIVVAGTVNNNFAVARYNSNGSLDTTLDGDGKVTFDFAEDEARAVAVQSDGKIVVVGNTVGDLAILRFNVDGSFDTSFSVDGRVYLDIGGFNDFGNAVAIQPDGKIVVAGLTNTSSTGANKNWVVIRLNPNGTLDSTFSGDGLLETDFNFGDDVAADVLVQPDGKIVVGGTAYGTSVTIQEFALARYNTDGSPDTSFSGDGKAMFNIGDGVSEDRAEGLALTSDGKYIIVGGIQVGSLGAVGMARITSSGLFDSTFSGDGKVISDLYPNERDFATDVVLQSDGKIVLTYNVGGGYFVPAFGIVRYTSSGDLDPSFGTGGKVRTIFSTTDGHQHYAAIAYQSVSFGIHKIIAVGSYRTGTDHDFAVARYTRDGIASSSDFSGDGRAEFAVFRPSNGTWYFTNTITYTAAPFGINGDAPTPGDYDGDDRTDAAVFRGGVWYTLSSSNQAFGVTQFGFASDKPVQGDYDGDGRTDIAVFRPSDGVWHLLRSTLGYSAQAFGLSEDRPVPGDYDGDGVYDLAVFRPSNGVWYVQGSVAGFSATQFGVGTDRPVAADYDGDGKTDIAVFRPSTGVWYIINSNSNSYTISQFGIATDIPSSADFDGDGQSDIAVFRPSNGAWYVQNSTGSVVIYTWGLNGDIPIPSAYAPQ